METIFNQRGDGLKTAVLPPFGWSRETQKRFPEVVALLQQQEYALHTQMLCILCFDPCV